MHTKIKSEIKMLANASKQAEICGFICANSYEASIFPCPNVASDVENEFEVDGDDYIRALDRGDLLGLYHSHNGTPAGFSPADLECAQELALPLYLYNTADNSWSDYIPPTYDPPLEGQRFILGFQDCYNIPRHYFRHHFKRYLSDYDRDETFIHEEQSVIMQSFDKEGFYMVETSQIKEHDVLLFKSDKLLPQHFGVYLGRNRFLHHPQGGLSSTESLHNRWLSRLICAFRLK